LVWFVICHIICGMMMQSSRQYMRIKLRALWRNVIGRMWSLSWYMKSLDKTNKVSFIIKLESLHCHQI
jgi:hypothetical protein